MAPNNVNSDAARKRMEIGLPARRETANRDVLRPPTSTASLTKSSTHTSGGVVPTPSAPILAGFGGWWLVLFTSLLALATFLLIAARFIESPTDLPAVNAEVVALTEGRVDLKKVEGALSSRRGANPDRCHVPTIFDDFSQQKTVLAPGVSIDEWLLSVEPAVGIYKMELWPNKVAWATIGNPTTCDFRLETSALITTAFPTGVAGLVLRFGDADNFYRFTVDQAGQYEIVARREGVSRALQPLTASPALNAAGMGNVLAVQDGPATVQFFANGTLLYEEANDPAVSRVGDVGVWAAGIDTLAEIRYDYLRLEPVH